MFHAVDGPRARDLSDAKRALLQRQRGEKYASPNESVHRKPHFLGGRTHLHHIARVRSNPSTFVARHPSMQACQGGKNRAPHAAYQRIHNASSAVQNMRIFSEFSRQRPHRTVTLVSGPKPPLEIRDIQYPPVLSCGGERLPSKGGHSSRPNPPPSPDVYERV